MRLTTRSQFSALWTTHDDSLVLYEPILRPNTVEFCAMTRTVGAKKKKTVLEISKGKFESKRIIVCSNVLAVRLIVSF